MTMMMMMQYIQHVRGQLVFTKVKTQKQTLSGVPSILIFLIVVSFLPILGLRFFRICLLWLLGHFG